MKPLPPFAAIRAFEAAARQQSFKEAASELGLTPAAVSYQVKQLEDWIGHQLFMRSVRKVTLSDKGKDLLTAITPALDALTEAFIKVSQPLGRTTVTLGAGPIFASRWLVPRLGQLWSRHPQIDLRLHHSQLPVWQQMHQFDLAVAWGRGNWRGLECIELLRIRTAPVLSPEALPDADGVLSPAGLLDLPLLHHRDDKAWRQWLEAAGVDTPRQLPGTIFEDANVLLQATLSGRGVSLGILDFIADELSSGRLMQPFPLMVDPGDAYHLVWRNDARSNAAAQNVRDWLIEMAKQTELQ